MPPSELEYFCPRHGKLPSEDVVRPLNSDEPCCVVCLVRRERNPRVEGYTKAVSVEGDLDGPGD